MSERKDDPPLFGGIQIEKQKSPFLGGPVVLKIWAHGRESSVPHSLDDIGPIPPSLVVSLPWEEAIAVGESIREAGEWSRPDRFRRLT